jgi:hypothetical protein
VRNFAGRQRAAEVIALDDIAAKSSEPLSRCLVFDPFGDTGDAKLRGQLDH